MAVPKHKRSKKKTKIKKAIWKKKMSYLAKKSLSLAKSILKDNDTTFIYKM